MYCAENIQQDHRLSDLAELKLPIKGYLNSIRIVFEA